MAMSSININFPGKRETYVNLVSAASGFSRVTVKLGTGCMGQYEAV